MQRLRFALLILALLLTSCAAGVNAQSEEVKTADRVKAGTDLPETSTFADTAKSRIISENPPLSCPVTQAPEVPFTPPDPYPAQPPERYENQFWYGTPELWTMLGADGIWHSLPHNKAGYSQKVFWWSQDFHRATDPYPAFTLIIERLDVPSAPIAISERATNASADFGTAMLTGVDIPELGCWRITGNYKEAELSFVVSVTR